MKTILFLLAFTFSAVIVEGQQASLSAKEVSPEQKELAGDWMNSRDAGFRENRGQMADMQGTPVNELLFKTGAPGVDMYITKWGLSYVFIRTKEEAGEKSGITGKEKKENIKTKYCRADMELVGAKIKTENIIKEYESNDFSNYYLGHCPNGILNVKRYGKITIKEVYPNIDWVIYSSSPNASTGKKTVNGVKYDFIVHAGGDPTQIKFKYKWTDRPNKKDDGSLFVGTPLGNITEGSPYSYMQETNAQIQTTYTINKQTNEISFTMAHYNQAQTLIIDPQLVWSTYFGGNSLDGPVAICKDYLNNIYFTGYETSTDFPVLNPGGGAYFQGVLANAKGVDDMMMVKFSNAGNLLWATYYGGSSSDEGTGITCDAAGNLFVAGTTSSTNFPLPPNPGGLTYFQGTLSGPRDLFILKFNSSGVPQWGTYYGGSAYEDNGRIVADNAGNIFILAATGSTNLPLKNPGGGAYYQSTYGGGVFDACVMEFTNAGVLQWATYYGGSGQDDGTMNSGGANIDISSTGEVFICGYTSSGASFPLKTLAGAYNQSISGGMLDAFVLKFTNTGVLEWATFFGGNANDKAYAIYCDLSGNLYVAGSTVSTNLPVLNPMGGAYYQPANAGGTSDLFITEFNSAGNLTWCTYYGGSDLDGGYYNMGLGKDCSGNLFLCGYTASSDLPLVNPGLGTYFKNTILGNGTNAFIAEWNNDCALVWATYYGGNFATDLLIDANNYLFVTGESNITGMNTLDPGGSAYYQTTFTGDEGMMIKLSPANGNQADTVKANPPSICPGETSTLTVTGNAGYNWFPSTGLNGTTGNMVIATPAITTTYTVIAGTGNCPFTNTVVVNVVNNTVGGHVTAIRDTICKNTAGNLTLTNNSDSTIQWQSSINDTSFTSLSGAVKTNYKTIPLQQSAWYRASVGTGNCSAFSDTLKLYVPPALIASFYSVQTGANELSFNSDSSIGSIRSYHWDFGDNSTSNDRNPLHTYAKDSTYYVCLTLYDGSNCSYTYCRYLSVISGIPTVSAMGNFIIYPNPFSNNIFIDGRKMNTPIRSIEMYDLVGRKIYTLKDGALGETNSELQASIDLSGLPAGMYILKIKTPASNYFQQIIKQ